MAFSVERRPNGRATCVVVTGELDMDTGPRVNDELLRAEIEGPERVVLDLTGVSFFDSTGLQIVLDAEVRARDATHTFAVVTGDGEVLRVLRLAEVTDRLTIQEEPDGTCPP